MVKVTNFGAPHFCVLLLLPLYQHQNIPLNSPVLIQKLVTQNFTSKIISNFTQQSKDNLWFCKSCRTTHLLTEANRCSIPIYQCAHFSKHLVRGPNTFVSYDQQPLPLV